MSSKDKRGGRNKWEQGEGREGGHTRDQRGGTQGRMQRRANQAVGTTGMGSKERGRGGAEGWQEGATR